MLFQSLLWWIGSRQREHADGSISRCEVSILVVVDCSRQPAAVIRPGRHRSWFQSLLWWIESSTGSIARLGESAIDSFNPCCGGLQSSTRLELGDRDGRYGVSILVVVDCSRQPDVDRPACGSALFQSLLWWIAVVNDGASRRRWSSC